MGCETEGNGANFGPGPDFEPAGRGPSAGFFLAFEASEDGSTGTLSERLGGAENSGRRSGCDESGASTGAGGGGASRFGGGATDGLGIAGGFAAVATAAAAAADFAAPPAKCAFTRSTSSSVRLAKAEPLPVTPALVQISTSTLLSSFSSFANE